MAAGFPFGFGPSTQPSILPLFGRGLQRLPHKSGGPPPLEPSFNVLGNRTHKPKLRDLGDSTITRSFPDPPRMTMGASVFRKRLELIFVLKSDHTATAATDGPAFSHLDYSYRRRAGNHISRIVTQVAAKGRAGGGAAHRGIHVQSFAILLCYSCPSRRSLGIASVFKSFFRLFQCHSPGSRCARS